MRPLPSPQLHLPTRETCRPAELSEPDRLVVDAVQRSQCRDQAVGIARHLVVGQCGQVVACAYHRSVDEFDNGARRPEYRAVGVERHRCRNRDVGTRERRRHRPLAPHVMRRRRQPAGRGPSGDPTMHTVTDHEGEIRLPATDQLDVERPGNVDSSVHQEPLQRNGIQNGFDGAHACSPASEEA